MITRRLMLAGGAAAAVSRSFAANARWKVGAMDGVLGKRSDAASLEVAKRVGAEGVQVTLGRAGDGTPLPLADKALQAKFLAESKAQGVPLISTYIDILHENCLKNDAKGLTRAVEGIEITKALDAKILMLVFFGKCALENRTEMDAVVGPLKELAVHARRAGVVLGFENTISAEDNLRILDQVKSPSLRVWYDIGNATNLYHEDPAKGIRALRGRLCQVHFKDKGYLGEGAVNVKAALDALQETGYQGYIVLETGSPSKDVEGDLKRNIGYLKGLMG